MRLEADWDDGSAPEVIDVDQIDGSFNAQHQYSTTGTYT